MDHELIHFRQTDGQDGIPVPGVLELYIFSGLQQGEIRKTEAIPLPSRMNFNLYETEPMCCTMIRVSGTPLIVRCHLFNLEPIQVSISRQDFPDIGVVDADKGLDHLSSIVLDFSVLAGRSPEREELLNYILSW